MALEQLRYSSEIDRTVNYNCTAPKRNELRSSVLKSRDRFGKYFQVVQNAWYRERK